MTFIFHSVELKKFRNCFKKFKIEKCYADYVKKHGDMRKPMERLADMKSSMHNFEGLLCGLALGRVNLNGLPEHAKGVPKCKKKFYEDSKQCAKSFHGKFVKNRNATELCP